MGAPTTTPTTGLRLGLIMFGAVLACFAVGFPTMLALKEMNLIISSQQIGLDDSIFSTVVPTIASEFGDLSHLGWYGSAYFLPQAVLQPFFGNLYTLWNARAIYLTSLALFEAGSVIAALAGTSNVLIMGRTLSGVGAAGIGIGGLQILKVYVEERLQGIVIGVVFAVLGISNCLGPLLGGIITDGIGWRYCFWLNIPLGAMVLITMTLAVTPKIESQNSQIGWANVLIENIHKMDILGSLLLSGTVITLLLGLQYLCVSPVDMVVVSAFLFGTAILGLACAVQQLARSENHMFPLRVVLHTWPICGTMFFLSAATTSQLYYLPFFCQSVLEKSARASGVLTIAYAASMSIGAMISAVTMTYFPNVKIIALVGVTLVGSGGGLFSLLQTDTSPGQLIGFQLISGAGVGLCLILLSVCSKLMQQEKDVALAQCSVIFFQILGGALGVQVSNVIFTNALQAQTENLTISKATLSAITLDLGKLKNAVSADLLPSVLEAFRASIRLVFVYTIITCVAAWVFAWFIQNKPSFVNLEPPQMTSREPHMTSQNSGKIQGSTFENVSQIELVQKE